MVIKKPIPMIRHHPHHIQHTCILMWRIGHREISCFITSLLYIYIVKSSHIFDVFTTIDTLISTTYINRVALLFRQIKTMLLLLFLQIYLVYQIPRFKEIKYSKNHPAIMINNIFQHRYSINIIIVLHIQNVNKDPPDG